MKRRIIKLLAVILAALILCLAPVIVSEYAKHQPITIKTSLADDEVVPHVKLSDGELHFKTDSEKTEQLTFEDREEARLAMLPYMNGQFSPAPENMSSDELKSVMNLHPECWKTSASGWRETAIPFSISTDPESGVSTIVPMYGGAVFKFSDGYSTTISISTPGYGVLSSRGEMIDGASRFVRTTYGHRDSVLGDVPMTVIYNKSWDFTRDGEVTFYFGAEFAIGGTRYMVDSRGITQREFIELLISICEAPRENTQDVVEYILEHE